uniref:BHLH domain-containing protein n=1 Tax=Knipowitschia caucasica TaxID=637954 RepID=A0AAV2M721_KNICA
MEMCVYKYKAEAAHGRLSTQSSTSTHGSYSHCSNGPLSGPQPLSQAENPVVEKLRRERINSSIEKLKSLLCTEFLQQQSDSKLEKADILEMTVTVLTRLQQQHFLSQSLMKSPQQRHCTELHKQSSFCKDKSPVNGAPWRPW